MGPATTDLIGGRTQLLLASGGSLRAQVRAGQLRTGGIARAAPGPIAPEPVSMAGATPGCEFEP